MVIIVATGRGKERIDPATQRKGQEVETHHHPEEEEFRMFAMTRPRMLVAVIVWVAFAALLALGAFSSTAEADHSWGGYHWARTSSSFTLQLDDNLSGTWKPYLATTSSDWSKDDYPNPVNTTTVPSQNTKQCRPTSGRVEVCNSTYGRNGWLGIAGISVSGNHITQGYTKLNDSYFNTAPYNTPAWRNLVMCQEVGHTFGLDHQDENFDNENRGSCMDYARNPAGPPSNEHPNKHDYEQLSTIYSHLDSTTTVGQTSAANKTPAAAADEADLDDKGPTKWGQLIRQSPDRRLALYRKDLGGDHKVFRFVIWTENAPQLNGKGRQVS
jgi:hypothetical protein